MPIKSLKPAASALLPTGPRLLRPWALWPRAPLLVQALLELALALLVLPVPLHPQSKTAAMLVEAAAAVATPLRQLIMLPLLLYLRLPPLLLLVGWWLLPGCRCYIIDVIDKMVLVMVVRIGYVGYALRFRWMILGVDIYMDGWVVLFGYQFVLYLSYHLNVILEWL